jgi:DNA-binding NtrC family response regulator
VLCKGHTIVLDDLPAKLVSAAAAAITPTQSDQPMSLKEAMEEPEKRILEAALRANDWNRQLTALDVNARRTAHGQYG